MKNLHLIATDKPSRLWTNNLRRRLEIDEFPEQHPTNIAKQIFITSNEEIKEGDWIYRRKGLYETIQKATFPLNLTSVNKKIILTTDQVLIADGIQAIDDNFLEWFVENPSCEKVDLDTFSMGDKILYNVVFPKEEPKQTKCYCGHTTYCDCGPEEPKQETLEKGVDKYFKLSHSRLKNEQQKEYERELFIAGAKWQAERMYSEEEVFSLMCKAFEAGYKKYDVVEAGLEGLETEIECNRILKK